VRRDIHTEFKAPPRPASAAHAFAITYRAAKPGATARRQCPRLEPPEEDVKLRGRKARADQILKGRSTTEAGATAGLGTSPVDSPAGLPQQTTVDLAALGRLHADLRSTSDERLRALDRRNDILRRLAEAESTSPAATLEAPTRLAHLKGELADLRQRFSDKYPDVIRVQAEIASLEAGAAEACARPPPRRWRRAPPSPA
jgi:hypothetical protein